ncbi:MAG: ABC transporter permease [Gammaproteobacteria bacterium]|nr:ABC transporter permease [Gammaproteobacteria bacterium]MDH5728021.1 ABC transporter permease [Gammaproteobacteria bacterium]
MSRIIAPIILLLWVVLALFGPWLPLNPDIVNLQKILHTPASEAWLGYDDLGRPVWDRLVMGARTSFLVAIWVMLISLFIGTFIGTMSAYVGGKFDLVVVRVIDVFLAVPGILLAIALAGIMGPGIENVVFALSIVGWVGYARLARAQVLTLKHRDHVQAAIALGTRPLRIMLRHLIPLISAPLIVEATFGIAGAVIAEAGLSFLGLGVQPPEASWGSMIKDGTRYMLMAPHMVIAPGMAIMLVVLAVNLLGDRLRDVLDVRGRAREN